MPLDAVKLRRYRRAFGWALLVSVVVLAASSYVLLAASTDTPSGSAPSEVSLYISIASLATSAASLAGFLLTLALAWRKERRESRHSEVDLERKKLELEKLLG